MQLLLQQQQQLPPPPPPPPQQQQQQQQQQQRPAMLTPGSVLSVSGPSAIMVPGSPGQLPVSAPHTLQSLLVSSQQLIKLHSQQPQQTQLVTVQDITAPQAAPWHGGVSPQQGQQHLLQLPQLVPRLLHGPHLDGTAIPLSSGGSWAAQPRKQQRLARTFAERNAVKLGNPVQDLLEMKGSGQWWQGNCADLEAPGEQLSSSARSSRRCSSSHRQMLDPSSKTGG
ncbi:hypothetical protein OEZ86_004313 [Tetradesmus obliquus]|nr:hypothetical protein OEZ86_004313 [Tetradesmus obliquus]